MRYALIATRRVRIPLDPRPFFAYTLPIYRLRDFASSLFTYGPHMGNMCGVRSHVDSINLQSAKYAQQ